MCGIAGIISKDPSQVNTEILGAMNTSLAHRGPDGEAAWINSAGKTGLAHRRLAVIDLSQLAAQPMHYLKRYTIVYNGEIYNYPELREKLKDKGYQFQTRSDTEVILAAFDCYREKCLSLFDGMFAFALWDEQEQCLFAARDRFGEKPFYYAFDENRFLFASERKALWAAGIPKEVNEPLLVNYLALGYTQTALDKTISFFKHVYSLPPAHFLLYQASTHEFDLQSWWDPDKQTEKKIAAADATEQFRELLKTSVQRRLRSDVTTGCSLSGGIDSSAIASLIRAIEPDREIKSFSALFNGFEKDEREYINEVVEAKHLQSHFVFPDAASLVKNLQKVCYHQEEPFLSSSVNAQFEVFASAAQNGTTVLLDGQGADETLGGYDKYISWYLQELVRRAPKKLIAEWRAWKKSGAPFSMGLGNFLAALFPAQATIQLEKREAKRIRAFAELDASFREQYFDRHSLYKPLVLRLNDMLYYNTCQSGLEELLRYADRNSMAHGREVRLPFLSHELVEFIFSLPAAFKMQGGWSKWILRESMRDLVPQKITGRRNKTGFEPPQKNWMQDAQVQELVQEARRSLVNKNILSRQVLNRPVVAEEAYAPGNTDWKYLVLAQCIA